mmetsp:Transcript_4039/g.7827  ORF Transcript_4039/g.7827 Transcript_4039/m.7827 type:complete len:112 (+) Transcript_4039:2303-2638(+)
MYYHFLATVKHRCNTSLLLCSPFSPTLLSSLLSSSCPPPPVTCPLLTCLAHCRPAVYCTTSLRSSLHTKPSTRSLSLSLTRTASGSGREGAVQKGGREGKVKEKREILIRM